MKLCARSRSSSILGQRSLALEPFQEWFVGKRVKRGGREVKISTYVGTQDADFYDLIDIGFAVA